MGYYDSVKDDVKNEGSDSENGNNASFSTLKEKAEEEVGSEGDDTPIEVLDEGLEEKSSNESQDQGSNSSFPPAEEDSKNSSSENVSGLEQKLDRIIEQNDKMIEILESFGN